MMLEMSPAFTFGVLAPAFKGCEMKFAYNEYASAGCTFLIDEQCELHGTGYQPLECRFCHHDRAVTQIWKKIGKLPPGRH